MSDTSILIGMTVALIAVTAAYRYLPLGCWSTATSFVANHLHHADTKSTPVHAEARPPCWPHDRLDHRLSLDEAHEILSSRQHYDCGIECPRKSAALAVVASTGGSSNPDTA
ncbi:hypothetical protein [Nocardia vaccinii]|uniref:hypothetical protein n=1 Tax=Nocardia vaccinii TaxID=1822 RepID=UPI00082B6BCC|nr:hypothetical protein [Nocardia vaccinii]